MNKFAFLGSAALAALISTSAALAADAPVPFTGLDVSIKVASEHGNDVSNPGGNKGTSVSGLPIGIEAGYAKAWGPFVGRVFVSAEGNSVSGKQTYVYDNGMGGTETSTNGLSQDFVVAAGFELDVPFQAWGVPLTPFVKAFGAGGMETQTYRFDDHVDPVSFSTSHNFDGGWGFEVGMKGMVTDNIGGWIGYGETHLIQYSGSGSGYTYDQGPVLKKIEVAVTWYVDK